MTGDEVTRDKGDETIPIDGLSVIAQYLLIGHRSDRAHFFLLLYTSFKLTQGCEIVRCVGMLIYQAYQRTDMRGIFACQLL